MQFSETTNRILNYSGAALCILGVLFVTQRFFTYADQVNFSHIHHGTWLGLITVSFIYGISNLCLSVSWRKLLCHLRVDINRKLAIQLYGISLLAKYVPGNVAQFAGRQALGMAAGLPAGSLAKTILLELGLIIIIGITFSPLILPTLLPKFPTSLACVIFGLLVVTVLLILKYRLNRHIASAGLWLLIFLTISGGVFISIFFLVAQNDSSIPPLSVLCGVYIVAWLAGLITPGSPAGIGIREAALIFLLGSLVAQADLLLAVLLSRGVTLTGDLIFFFASLLLKFLKAQ